MNMLEEKRYYQHGTVGKNCIVVRDLPAGRSADGRMATIDRSGRRQCRGRQAIRDKCF